METQSSYYEYQYDNGEIYIEETEYDEDGNAIYTMIQDDIQTVSTTYDTDEKVLLEVVDYVDRQ